MKQPLLLCLAVLASACSSSPDNQATDTPTHTAVSAYLKKTLDDPASYQPVHWGKEEPVRRVDSVSMVALPLLQSSDRNQAEEGIRLMKTLGKDSTKQIGTTMIHSFRAKNKMGGLILDSARFMVTKAGKVAILQH